jgi:hypothetical protein
MYVGQSPDCRHNGVNCETPQPPNPASRTFGKSTVKRASRWRLLYLTGRKFRVKEVGDGILLATFMHYDLGFVDLEQKSLQLSGNRFGTRLSPMS